MPEPTPQLAEMATMTARLRPAKVKVQAAFDTMAEATATLPRRVPGLVARLRGPLGKLVTVGQQRDAFDQRLSHLEAAADRAEGREAAERAAARLVIAQQLVEVAALVEATAKTASAAYGALADLAERADGLAPDVTREILAVARRGLEAATRLQAAAELMAIEADGQAAGVDRGVPASAIAAADLGWVQELYTMEEERRAHRAALAAIGGAA